VGEAEMEGMSGETQKRGDEGAPDAHASRHEIGSRIRRSSTSPLLCRHTPARRSRFQIMPPPRRHAFTPLLVKRRAGRKNRNGGHCRCMLTQRVRKGATTLPRAPAVARAKCHGAGRMQCAKCLRARLPVVSRTPPARCFRLQPASGCRRRREVENTPAVR